jgi:phenylalanyl-tRNA synthetase beta chain
VARAGRVLGFPLTEAQCVDAFSRLKLQHRVEEGRIVVTPPSWRFDLQIEEDLIEELIRVIGLQHLPDTPPVAAVVSRPIAESRSNAYRVRHALAALGYQETINFSFVEERSERELAGNADPIRVLNPIAAPLAVMRSSLIGSLVGVLRHNLARRTARVRIFELGRVFSRDNGIHDGPLSVAGVAQPMRVGALGYGAADEVQWGSAERQVDFYDLKGDIETLLAPRRAVFVADTHPALHPGRCARVEVDGRCIGHVGELHPRWRQAYELPHAPVLFELDLEAVQQRPLPQATPVPRHQPSLRDIALVVGDAIGHDQLVSVLAADPSGLVRSVTLFDVYRPARPGGDIGADERSLALRLEILDDEHNLTDARIDATVAAAVQRAQTAFSARLRS